MLYLISDIHGQMRDFIKILDRIEFDKNSDHMIIMGDIIDRGPDGLELIDFIQPFLRDGSMELIMGNHELFADMYINGTLSERTWVSFGGGETVKGIKRMPKHVQYELSDFFRSLPYYTVIDSEDKGSIVITHTGIDPENYVYRQDGRISVTASIDKAVSCRLYSYIIGTDLHNIPEADKRLFDAYLIVGHVPCCYLNPDKSNKFYKTKYYMDIDAGAGHKAKGGKLGCYCMDTGEEIYV